MTRSNLKIDLHRYHEILASSTSLNHSIHWKAALGKLKRSVEWSEHSSWIALQFLSAPRMTGQLQRKQPLMKWWWEQCGHYVNCLDFLADTITRIYPSKYHTMHSCHFARRRVFSENRTCWSLWRAKWMTCWQRNPISYANIRFIWFMLQRRPLFIGLTKFL